MVRSFKRSMFYTKKKMECKVGRGKNKGKKVACHRYVLKAEYEGLRGKRKK